MKRLLGAITIACLSLAAAAQPSANTPAKTIWRCGADGRSYSDQPCTDGRTQGAVDAQTAPRPAADVEDARARALREQRRADRLRSERLAQQAADAKAAQAARTKTRVKPSAAAASAASAAQPKRQAKRRRPADDGTFRAVAPGSRPTKG